MNNTERKNIIDKLLKGARKNPEFRKMMMERAEKAQNSKKELIRRMEEKKNEEEKEETEEQSIRAEAVRRLKVRQIGKKLKDQK